MNYRVTTLLALLCAACGSDGVDLSLAPFSVQAPGSDEIVNTARPTVRWTLRAGAWSYSVVVSRDAAGQDVVEAREFISGIETTLQHDLQDATTYYVWVTANTFGREPIETVGPSRCHTVLTPEWFPEFRLVANDTSVRAEGFRLVSLLDIVGLAPDRTGALILFNEKGEIVWWYTSPSGGPLTVFKPTPDGTVLFANGVVGREMDWFGNILWTRPGDALLHHEIRRGPGGFPMYLKWVIEDHEGTAFEGDGIEVVNPDTNEIVWSWNMFDHIRPEDHLDVRQIANPGRSGLGVDWSHANALSWDPGRSIIWMSIRHFDQVIGIDYPSGDIVVTLGKGGIGGAALTSHQHAVDVQPDGSLMIWSNGNTHDPQVSRVVQFSFDAVLETTEVLFEWTDDPPIYDRAVGDANLLENGNVQITAGVSGRSIEVDPSGRIVWELTMGNGTGRWFYRTELVPAAWLPASIADPFD